MGRQTVRGSLIAGQTVVTDGISGDTKSDASLLAIVSGSTVNDLFLQAADDKTKRFRIFEQNYKEYYSRISG